MARITTTEATVRHLSGDTSIRMAVGQGTCTHADIAEGLTFFGAGDDEATQLSNLAAFGHALAAAADGRKAAMGYALAQRLACFTGAAGIGAVLAGTGAR